MIFVWGSGGNIIQVQSRGCDGVLPGSDSVKDGNGDSRSVEISDRTAAHGLMGIVRSSDEALEERCGGVSIARARHRRIPWVVNKKKVLVRLRALRHVVTRIDGGFLWIKRCVTSCIVRAKIEHPQPHIGKGNCCPCGDATDARTTWSNVA